MFGEYALPSSVVLLKFGLRLFLDQEVKLVDGVKSFMAFPIDLAFLAFSYGAAGIVFAAHAKDQDVDIKTIMSFVAGCILSSVIIIVLAKRSDRAFVLEKNAKASILTAISYAMSAGVIYASLNVRYFI